MSGKNTKFLIVFILLIFLISIFPQLIYAQQNAPDTLWTKTYGDTTDEFAYSIVETPDKGYILAGITNSYDSSKIDFLVLKTDINGNLEWSQTFGGTGDDIARAIMKTSDGEYVIAGWTTSFGTGQKDGLIIKIDSNGQEIWQTTLGGTEDDLIYDAQPTNNNGIILAGISRSFGKADSTAWLIKLDSEGNIQWNSIYNSNIIYSVKQTSDGGFILAGEKNNDSWFAKTDEAGRIIWEHTQGNFYDTESFNAVKQTNDGGYIFAGKDFPYLTGYGYMTLIKTDREGKIQFGNTFGGYNYPYTKGAASVERTSDGGYLVIGTTVNLSDIWLIKTDSLCQKEWELFLGGENLDFGHSVIQDSQGDYVVVGGTTSYGTGGADVWLIKVRGKRETIQPPLVTTLIAPSSTVMLNGSSTENPFTLVVKLSNTAPGATQSARGISTILTLPDGLELAPGENARHDIPDLDVGEEYQTSYQIKVKTTAAGHQVYSLLVEGTNINSTTMEKDIFVFGIETNPPDGGKILSKKTITVTFNLAMDANTINEETFTIMDETTNVTGTVMYNVMTRTAIFQSADSLKVGKNYNAILSTNIKSSDGIGLPYEIRWSFSRLPSKKYFIGNPAETERGAIMIREDVFPEGKGARIPIYVPPVINGSNIIREDEEWITIKEFEMTDIDWNWAKLAEFYPSFPEEPLYPLSLGANIPAASAFAFVAELLKVIYNVITISNCKITIQKDTQDNLRAMIQLGDPKSETFIRKYAGQGRVEPLKTSFWLIRAAFSNHIENIFKLEKDNFPLNYYTMDILMDLSHKKDKYIGYLSLSKDNQIIVTPKVYQDDELRVLRTHEFLGITYKVEEIMKINGESYVNFLEAPLPTGIIKILSPTISKDLVIVMQGKSPIEIRIYDSEGNISGLENGYIKEEIPYSIYDLELNAVIILEPFDNYKYYVIGKGKGSYDLEINYIENKQTATFTALNIPILSNLVYQYTIDWETLSKGEKGVTVKIDYDNDGILEQTIITGDTFTEVELTPPTGGVLKNGNIYVYPNPFNPHYEPATIRYSLSKRANITIKIYDANNKLVKFFNCGNLQADIEYSQRWDGKNEKGEIVANGVYFYVIESSSGEKAVGKIAVLR